MEYSTYGRHVAVDAWEIDFEVLNVAEVLAEKMVQVAVSRERVCRSGLLHLR